MVFYNTKFLELENIFTDESLAFKFFLKNMADPLVMLWTYYFLEKNPKADELWEKFIKYRHTVSCEEFFYFSRMKNDADLNLKLANIVVQSSITRRAKLAIYTQLLKNCMKMSKGTLIFLCNIFVPSNLLISSFIIFISSFREV